MSRVLSKRSGVTVTLDDHQAVVYSASTAAAWKALTNSARFLEALSNTGYVPRILRRSDSVLEVEYIDSERVTDPTKFMRRCAGLLITLLDHGVVHGDLTSHNILVRDNSPVAIDFSESRLVSERHKDKRPEGDAYWLWKAFLEFSDDPNRIVRRWSAIREHLVGRTLLDIGCYEGDFPLLAAAEGYNAAGQDQTEPEAWANVPATLAVGDVLSDLLYSLAYDNVLLLSTWAWLYRQQAEIASELLSDIIKSCKVLFFETQLAGDGPGLEQHRTKDDVAEMLEGFGGLAEELITLPVAGRDAERTVFKVVRRA